jgi:hypothetical protein
LIASSTYRPGRVERNGEKGERMAGRKAKRAKAKSKGAKAKSKVASKKAAKPQKSADSALRSQLASARTAGQESERKARDFASVLRTLGAPTNNLQASRRHAERMRKEAALAASLRKQLDSLKAQGKAAATKLQAQLAKAKKEGAGALALGKKSAVKLKAAEAQIALRDKRIKTLAAGAKQGDALKKATAAFAKQRADLVEKAKQREQKLVEAAKKQAESLQLVKKELAEKAKHAREGSRAIEKATKLTAQVTAAKEAHKQHVLQLKATEQRAKEAEKKLEAIDKREKQLEKQRLATPPALAQSSNRLSFQHLHPPVAKTVDAAKARIKKAENALKLTPPRPKPKENVDDELPFDEEDFEEEEVEIEEEEEERPEEGGEETKGKPAKKRPPKVPEPDGDDEAPRDDES